jgi:hypothetical protein
MLFKKKNVFLSKKLNKRVFFRYFFRGQHSLSSMSMATANLFHQISRPLHFPTAYTTFRPPCTAVNFHLKHRKQSLKPKTKNHLKWAIKLSLVEQSPPKSNFDLEQLVGFLYEDLPHLFDDKGIDKSAYDERVFFRDPITKHDDLSGYLFNIALLKTLFTPRFQLHWVKPVCLFLSLYFLMVSIFVKLLLV